MKTIAAHQFGCSNYIATVCVSAMLHLKRMFFQCTLSLSIYYLLYCFHFILYIFS